VEPSANVRSVIDAHIVGMHSRFPHWKNDKQTAAAELIQAVRAVRAAVHLDQMMQIGGNERDGKGEAICQE
jgi:hypothetical protein